MSHLCPSVNRLPYLPTCSNSPLTSFSQTCKDKKLLSLLETTFLEVIKWRFSLQQNGFLWLGEVEKHGECFTAYGSEMFHFYLYSFFSVHFLKLYFSHLSFLNIFLEFGKSINAFRVSHLCVPDELVTQLLRKIQLLLCNVRRVRLRESFYKRYCYETA